MKQKNGFSLIELLIGISLSGIIFLVVSSIFFSVFASNARIKQEDSLEQTKNDVTLELTNAIRWAKLVTFYPATSELQVKDDADITHTYTFTNGQILKDSTPITANTVTIVSFSADDFSRDPNLASLKITIEMADKKFPTVSEVVTFVVSQRVKTITSSE